jgi:wyosine [tRNA(Phe)-imidazoG37] synthetase (radical SAM superfamily)
MKAEGGTPRVCESPSHSFVYGPVPSRRLGLSLGINIVPFKTCTLDCIYCQCGKTTKKTIERRSFFPINDILAAVRNAIRPSSCRPRSAFRVHRSSFIVPGLPPTPAVRQSKIGNLESRIDFLTFSGEGEPTLNQDIGRIIRRLKHEFSIPVAVITNSTLLTNPQVRHDLYAADLVIPSLDAADQRNFARVDRNHRDLRVVDIIEGLKLLRRGFRGRIWLEIMLVKDVNDSVEHVVALRKAAWEIKPDRVQLNTVVRPPAEKSAKPLPLEDLDQIQCLFGPNTDIIGEAKSKVQSPKSKVSESPDAAILATVQGRPVRKLDLVCSLGVGPRDIEAALHRLLRARRIKAVEFRGKTFYALSYRGR